MPDPNPIRVVVHDLRNRLSAIASATTAIRKSGYEKELSEEMTAIIRDNIDQATSALNDLDRLGGEDDPA